MTISQSLVQVVALQTSESSQSGTGLDLVPAGGSVDALVASVKKLSGDLPKAGENRRFTDFCGFPD